MHFTCQKMHSTVRASLAGILLAQTRSKLPNAVEFYTPGYHSKIFLFLALVAMLFS